MLEDVETGLMQKKGQERIGRKKKEEEGRRKKKEER